MLKADAQTPTTIKTAGIIAALAAVAIALAVGAFLSFSCAYGSESVSVTMRSDGSPSVEVAESSCESMLEDSPQGTLLFVGCPVALALIGLLGAGFGRHLPQFVGGVVILVFGLAFSILAFGLFPLYFAPTGVALLASAALSERHA